MTDQELDALIAREGPGYRVPKEGKVDSMWRVIEARAFDRRGAPASRPRSWVRVVAYAATLVAGIGLGAVGKGWLERSPATMPASAPGPGALTLAATGSEPDPFVGVARDYFQQSIALVVAIAGDLRARRGVEPETVSRARDLLSTTRLLLDGPLPDPAVHDLLQDLELVLAQVVRLPEARQPDADRELITDAMDQRDVLSRLTLVLADTRGTP